MWREFNVISWLPLPVYLYLHLDKILRKSKNYSFKEPTVSNIFFEKCLYEILSEYVCKQRIITSLCNQYTTIILSVTQKISLLGTEIRWTTWAIFFELDYTMAKKRTYGNAE
jgi:hypothetical protein